jgi:hypothetical protein
MFDQPSYFLIAWGGKAYHMQGLLAARSLVRRGARDVTIYTDNPRLFPPPLRPIEITGAELKALRGPLNFGHRAKIALIRRHLTSKNEACIFVDSDTYCAERLPAIAAAETRTLMHMDDGIVSSTFYPRLHRFLNANVKVFHEAGFSMVQPSFHMFNSGTIYFPLRRDTDADLARVGDLCDLACVHFPEQIEWLEQFSFNMILGTRGPIAPFPLGLVHYWGINFEVSQLLLGMSAADIERLADAPEEFQQLLDKARTLNSDLVHRYRLFIRRQKRSYRKRLTVFRAWRLRRKAR